jgi:fatty-acyl-CoA synthase
MFHCSGWTYTWAVTAVGGTHVCLRRVDPALIFPLIERHAVSHMCGAPIVLNMLVHAPAAVKKRFAHRVEVATGGAAPPSAIIEAMESMGFRVTHLYGLTESYGPATLCAWQEGWEGLELGPRSRLMARQGVRYPTLDDLQVADPDTHVPVPRDGETLGEVLLRGNTIMKGYLRNERATQEAFREGWYHTGDLAVWHADGYIEVKDRSKDIIISGGENISSLEVEECLYRHPQVMEAAGGRASRREVGRDAVRVRGAQAGAGSVAEEDIVAWCREHLARFKVPRTVVFGELPKTSTGKIQKFLLRQRAREL